MELFIYPALLAPLLGFLALVTFSSSIGRKLCGLVACSTVFISCILFSCALFHLEIQGSGPVELTVYQWIRIGKVNADCVLMVDSLSLLMTLIITGVGFLIHLFSCGYMDHEKDYARYFACLNFFVFMMLLLVLAGDLLLLFIGWEGVGLVSYLLIGFWYERPTAATAAVKAFVVNRIGDLGMLLGILLTFFLFGTSNISMICGMAKEHFAIGAPIITCLLLLYFFGATGKSAQLPLHTWLPDAMEGPTPVSTLIHAATMVTAGVYFIVRLHPLFNLSEVALNTIGIIGGVTALFAALSALAQKDLKRVLAYSTVSQLGYMFLACGSAAYYSAMFHLTMHAFVKALLFLTAGNVVHMMHGVTDMAKMGGLSRVFTKTHWMFLLGVLALAGLPPLATFFSKDLILENEYASGHILLFYIGLITALLTAVYLTFMGSLSKENSTVKEAPKIMLFPICILALLTLGGGFLGFWESGIPPLKKLLAYIGIKPCEERAATHFAYSNAK